MLLYLLRHAEAESVAAGDFERVLTPKGREQAARAGRFCRQNHLRPEVLLSSPVTRARQTADIVAKGLGQTEVIEAPWAACGMSPSTAMDELKAFRRFESVMVVGHQPDLGELAGALLGLAGPGALHVRKGLLLAIQTGGDPSPRLGVLELFVPSRLMG
jgi:phosphohistidine phosphatase